MRIFERLGGGASMTRVRRMTLVAAVLSLPLAVGCASNNDPETASEPVPPTRLRVENQAFLDMTIYVYRSTQRIRLGLATGSSTTRFTIPSNIVLGAMALRFQADPIGGNRLPVSQEIIVTPGDEVILTIPPT